MGGTKKEHENLRQTTRTSDVYLKTSHEEQNVLIVPQRAVCDVVVCFVVILRFQTNVKVYFTLEQDTKAQRERERERETV